ncbi:hypothetical protein EYC80_001029 [Monilinia laxa]|uniref:Uncharacterized protein n=1 Tax=Monilinia laxa TaxID=61186 RepID=A0A5N6K7V1_MONLA|nr:hypothetical protein EYC80_001029 [Monilinia laxa]
MNPNSIQTMPKRTLMMVRRVSRCVLRYANSNMYHISSALFNHSMHYTCKIYPSPLHSSTHLIASSV